MSMVPGGFIILKRLSGGSRDDDVARGRGAEIVREPRVHAFAEAPRGVREYPIA